MKSYIMLLKSNNTLRRLSFIQLITYFGAWFSNIAIYTLLLQLEVSSEVVAFVAMLHFLAGVIQAPFSGVMIDSIKPKKLMLTLILVEFISTFLLIYIVDISDLIFLYTLVFLKMAAASFYFTSEMSLLPKILVGDELQKANELHSIIWSLSYTFGMSVSGFVVYVFGIKVAFFLDSIMFFIAFILLYQIEIDVKLSNIKENVLFMIKDTMYYLADNSKAFHLMILHAFVGFTAFDALVALIVKQYYISFIATSLALGLVHSSRAIGLVIGPIMLGKWVNNKRLVYIFIFQGISIWIWAYFMDNFYLSLVASLFVGFFTTTLWSYSYTLLQKNVEEKYYGRIVAYNDMLFLSSAAFVSFMIGFLYSLEYSLECIAFFMGVFFLIAAVYYSWIIRSKYIEEIF